MGSFAAALLALVMLSYASVQSTVMRAGGTMAGMSMDGMSMAGMSMPGMADMQDAAASHHPGHKPAQGASHQAACPYCAAAATAPIMADFTPPRVPSAFVFLAFRVLEHHGPRGPPAREPQARGPPPISTSV